jgi:hypothetical protein
MWGRMYELKLFKSKWYNLEKCNMCESGNSVKYFLKCFSDLCVNGKKGLSILIIVKRGEEMWKKYFFFFVMVEF